mgnify:CR=1 FL=1
MSRNAIFPFVVAVVLFSVSSLPCVLASTADDEGNGLDSLIDMGALEEETAVYKSDSFAVTATMRKQGTIDVPSNVFVLDRKEIEALCVRDLGMQFLALIPFASLTASGLLLLLVSPMKIRTNTLSW